MTDTLYEYYNTNDDAATGTLGDTWRGQTFTVGAEPHTITSIKLKMYRSGSVGTLTVSIRNTTSGKPSGSDLTSGTMDGDTISTSSPGAWYEIPVTEYTLAASTQYAIVMRVSGAGTLYFRDDITSPTYTGGMLQASIDAGVTWSSYSSYDILFEVYGKVAATPISVSDSGTGTDNRVVEADIPITQTGSAIESALGLQGQITPTDSASGVDGLSQIALSLIDAGTGTDVRGLAAALTLTQTGAGADALTMTGYPSVTDASSAAVDSQTLQGQIPVCDSGAGIDMLIEFCLMVLDSSSGVEVPALTAYIFPDDTGAGVDVPSYGVLTFVYDTGQGVDAVPWRSLMLIDSVIGAEFKWRLKGSILLGSFTLPHVLRIAVTDEAAIADKTVQTGILPRRTLVGKLGRTVQVQGWTEAQADLDAMDALVDGLRHVFLHPSGDSFAVYVKDLNYDRNASHDAKRNYALVLMETR